MSIFCGILFGQTKTWPISMFTDVVYCMSASVFFTSGDEKTPQYLNFRGCIEVHDWKGI